MLTETADGSRKPLEYRGHIAGLDVLRGLAVLMVVVHHAYDNTWHWVHWHGVAAVWVAVTGMGHLGVHLFFVLSGFLITGILLDGKGRPGAAQRFYKRRARRILPAYVLLLAALWSTHIVNGHFVLASLLFVVNMGRLVGASLTQFSYLWSLAVEEQFYLIWPWIVWRCSLKTVGRMIVLCFLLPPLFRLALSAFGQDSYFKTWVNVDYLMYGALVAYTLRSGALHSGNLHRVTRWLYWAALAGMVLSALVWIFASEKLWALALFNAVGRTPEMLLFAAMLLSCLIAHQTPGLTPTRRLPGTGLVRALSTLRHLPTRFLVFLGYISYGLYLVHMLIFRLYDRQVVGTALASYRESMVILHYRALLCSTLSVLLAWLSRASLEEWCLRSSIFARKRASPATESGSSA